MEKASHILQLANAVHPKSASEKCLIMVQCYFDESGIHRGSPICLVGGYFGGVNQWRAFERRWKHALDREGINEFHAHQFWGRKSGGRVKPFSGWSDQRAETFLDNLLKVIGSVNIHPATYAVVTKDWNELTEGQRRFLTGGMYDKNRRKFITTGAPNKPYFLCFQFCIQAAALNCNPGLKVHSTFDLNKDFSGYAPDLWRQLKSRQDLSFRDQLGDMILSNSHDAAGLQAADLLCYLTYRWRVSKLSNPRHPISGELRQALAGIRRDTPGGHFDAVGLNSALRGCPV